MCQSNTDWVEIDNAENQSPRVQSWPSNRETHLRFDQEEVRLF